MLIVGARGFAKQLFEDLSPNEYSDLKFYDDINLGMDKLWDEFQIIHSTQVVKDYLRNTDKRFTLGIGNPSLRLKFAELFSSFGGDLINIISNKSFISKYAEIGEKGVNILKGVIIEADAKVSEGCLVNLNVTITHDCKIGRYSTISPGVHISGECEIGSFCQIGTGAVILPKIKIGDGVIVGAGAVVTKDIADNSLVLGVPARERGL